MYKNIHEDDIDVKYYYARIFKIIIKNPTKEKTAEKNTKPILELLEKRRFDEARRMPLQMDSSARITALYA